MPEHVNRVDHDAESSRPTNLSTLPTWFSATRITKETLAAAERARDYHVRKIESMVVQVEHPASSKSTEHH